MILSTKTTKILKNFCNINQSILIPEGNEIKTVNKAHSILALAKVEEEFPQQCVIYDLPQFLSVLGLFNKPELVFEDANYIKIKEGEEDTSCKYYLTSEKLVKAPPTTSSLKELTYDFSFTVDSSHLKKITKAESTLNLPDLKIEVVNGQIYGILTHRKNPTTNDFRMHLGQADIAECSYYLKTINLIMIPDDYTVHVSSQLIKFENKNMNVEYYIALQK
jgi:hypothetical protein